MVVADDDVTERRQPLLDPLYPDLIGETIAQMLEFLVGCAGRNEKALAISVLFQFVSFSAAMAIGAQKGSGKVRREVRAALTLLLTGRRFLCQQW